MRSATILFSCCLLALVPVSCGGGGGGGSTVTPTPSAAQWVGSWDYTGVQSSTTCVPDPQFGTQNASISIAITGTGVNTMAALDLGPFTITLPVVNNRIQGSSSFNLSTYDLELTGANSFSGTQTSSLSGCEVVFQVTGTRTGS